MKWTKGKPAAKAPVAVVLLCVFDYDGKTMYATMKARNGSDRFANPALEWAFYPSGARSDTSPSRYWLLP